MPLNRIEWEALNAFADDDTEPLEQVFFALGREGIAVAPDQFSALMFDLFRKGFVSIQQAPIMEQAFVERTIVPATPHEIIGDLGAKFEDFCSRGEYYRLIGGGGVPFGIYFVLTESGRLEYQKPEYASFHQEWSS